MKLQVLLAIALSLFCSIVSSLSIPYENMDDFEIANYLVANKLNNGALTGVIDAANDDGQGKILSPTPNTTWYVGDSVDVTFSEGSPNETVSIFFFDQTDILAGGPLSQKIFSFVVPPSAVSVPENGTSLLLAVRRQNLYLHAVDSVILHVLPRVF